MKEQVKQILIEIKENPNLFDNVSDNAHIINDIGLDSLQMLSFILKVEEVFDMQLQFESFDFNHLNSVDSFCAFLESQKNENKLAV